MNERIVELAQQAGYERDMFGIGHWDMPECKKFVQLIVKEVIELYNDDGHQTEYEQDMKVLTHFGME